MSHYEADDLLITSHLGDEYSKYLGAVVPPIFMNSLHVFDSVESCLNNDRHNEDSFVYGRVSNPTTKIVEDKVAALEKGNMALCFASGMAAATSAIMATCKAGSHIICIKNSYGPVKAFLNDHCVPVLNMSVTYIKGMDIAEFEQAVKPETALIILESPSTFVFSLQDLRAVSTLAKKHGIKTYIDNSFCTPLFQKPLEFGIDLVMHTASKYLGGHSDIIGGVLVSKDTELMEKIWCGIREWYGGVIGPMEAWLMMRGIRTLDVRVERHQKTAMAVAKFLEDHNKVRKVYYPGLESHPQHELMKKQQMGNTGLMSFELDTTRENTAKFINNLDIFQIGCSWGGFESLATMPLYTAPPKELDFIGAQNNLVRIHCGLEGTENLLEALDKALKTL